MLAFSPTKTGVNDFDRVASTQLDAESDMEEVSTQIRMPKGDIDLRLASMEEQNKQILNFLQSYVMGPSKGRAALPSLELNREYTVSRVETI